MTLYLISFPSAAMVLTDDELELAGIDATTVVEDAKAAGVLVVAGGVLESVEPVLVAADGSVAAGTHPGSDIRGGLTVVDVPTREEAVEWARRIAVACRCSQELRQLV